MPASPLRDPTSILAALHDAGGIISEAARNLGVSRQGFKAAMRRHGIKARPSRSVMRQFLSEAGQRGGRPRNPPRKTEDAA